MERNQEVTSHTRLTGSNVVGGGVSRVAVSLGSTCADRWGWWRSPGVRAVRRWLGWRHHTPRGLRAQYLMADVGEDLQSRPVGIRDAHGLDGVLLVLPGEELFPVLASCGRAADPDLGAVDDPRLSVRTDTADDLGERVQSDAGRDGTAAARRQGPYRFVFRPGTHTPAPGCSVSTAWCRSCHNGPISVMSSVITSGVSPVLRCLLMITARARSRVDPLWVETFTVLRMKHSSSWCLPLADRVLDVPGDPEAAGPPRARAGLPPGRCRPPPGRGHRPSGSGQQGRRPRAAQLRPAGPALAGRRGSRQRGVSPGPCTGLSTRSAD